MSLCGTYRTIVREVWRWNLSLKWVLGGFSLKQLESLLAPPSSSWQLTALQKRTRLLGVWSPAYIQKWHRVLPKSGATLRISTSWGGVARWPVLRPTLAYYVHVQIFASDPIITFRVILPSRRRASKPANVQFAYRCNMIHSFRLTIWHEITDTQPVNTPPEIRTRSVVLDTFQRYKSSYKSQALP